MLRNRKGLGGWREEQTVLQEWVWENLGGGARARTRLTCNRVREDKPWKNGWNKQLGADDSSSRQVQSPFTEAGFH